MRRIRVEHNTPDSVSAALTSSGRAAEQPDGGRIGRWLPESDAGRIDTVRNGVQQGRTADDPVARAWGTAAAAC